MPAWLILLSACLAGGCASPETFDAFAGAPPEKPAKLLFDGEVRLVALDGQPIDGMPHDSAPATPPGDIETEHNPRRILRIDPGEHTITVGLGRRWLPLLRETHIGLVFLTGAANYSAALYPGTEQNVQIRFVAQAGKQYTVKDKTDADRWWIELRPEAAQPQVVATVDHDGEGTSLLPGEWIKQRRAQEKSDRKGGGDDLTKPAAN